MEYTLKLRLHMNARNTTGLFKQNTANSSSRNSKKNPMPEMNSKSKQTQEWRKQKFGLQEETQVKNGSWNWNWKSELPGSKFVNLNTNRKKWTTEWIGTRAQCNSDSASAETTGSILIWPLCSHFLRSNYWSNGNRKTTNASKLKNSASDQATNLRECVRICDTWAWFGAWHVSANPHSHHARLDHSHHHGLNSEINRINCIHTIGKKRPLNTLK